jgi:hypothetical protein
VDELSDVRGELSAFFGNALIVQKGAVDPPMDPLDRQQCGSHLPFHALEATSNALAIARMLQPRVARVVVATRRDCPRRRSQARSLP